MHRLRFIGLAAVTLIAAGGAASAFVFIEGSPRWPSGAIVMHLQVGSPSSALLDGATSWTTPVENALADWNPHLTSREFRVVRDSTVPARSGDRVNSVFFSTTIFDRAFDDDTLAVATTWVSGSTRVEGDVIFNSAQRYNSYRGPLRPAASGGTLFDIRRVALHEFGHIVGLDHPDQAGQTVAAVMNSRVSNTEFLTSDDIAGAFSLYAGTPPPPPPPPPSGGGVTINFPPRNESATFRAALEARYRDVLRRNPSASFVDQEGTVVWTQEYLRYRVNQCSHVDAIARVMMQIDGQGIQPVCGTPASVVFPPRNEPFDFRGQLEAKYRDGLRRGSSQTFVDTEGDIVWTQEYLRYRVSGCTHDQGQDRVFQQIAGLGVQPDCGSGVPPPTGCTINPTSIGATITGVLSDADCIAPHRAGERADVYQFTGTAGQTVTLEMTSSAFDTYLLLVNAAGNVLAFNDDFNGLNARIQTTLPASGAYTIEATTFEGGRGAYTLTIR